MNAEGSDTQNALANRTMASAGRPVRERVWQPSKNILKTCDDSLELKLQLSSLREIELWTLSWGEHVRILGPAEIKNRVATRLKAELS